MAIDVYSVPAEHRTYIRENLFTDSTKQVSDDAVGVNIYQDFMFTKLNDKGVFGMTTGATAVLNHFMDLGFFCSYYFPKVEDFTVSVSEANLVVKNPKFSYNTYAFCGTTVGYIPLSEKIVHPRVGLDVGFGKTSATYQNLLSTNSTDTSYPFIILRPTINMEVNMYSFIQWRLGLGYRFQISILNSDSKTRNLRGTSSTADRNMSEFEVSTSIVFNAR